jgi:hypothetical protein
MKDVRAFREAFSHHKRTSSTLKQECLHFFLLLWVIFALLDPDPADHNQPVSGSITLALCDRKMLSLY